MIANTITQINSYGKMCDIGDIVGEIIDEIMHEEEKPRYWFQEDDEHSHKRHGPLNAMRTDPEYWDGFEWRTES